MLEIELDISHSKIIYKDTPEYLIEKIDNAVDSATAVREEGYAFSPSFRNGFWDGYTRFYDKKNKTFPSGLIEVVDKAIGEVQSRETFQFQIRDNRPDPLMEIGDVPTEIKLEGGITLRDYQYQAVVDAVEKRDGVIHHSTSSGKTITAIGLISVALEHLQPGETIGFFTHSKELFNQTHENLEKYLGEPVGKIRGSHRDIKRVNMIMVPTCASSLKIDVEKGLTFTANQMVVKKMATIIAPEYTRGKNQRMLLRTYIQNFQRKTKADERFLEEIGKMVDKSESDAKAIYHMNRYVERYEKMLYEKNKDKYNKKKNMQDFLDTIVLGVYDEVHSVKGDGYYTTVLATRNALMKVGLTGSIDYSQPVLIQKLKGTFFRKINTIRNKEMIDRGVSADLEVVLTPIRNTIIDGEEVTINERDWHSVYEKGIVKNEYRNALIARMAQLWYEKGEVVLIVVSRIEHGERIAELLNQLKVPHHYIYGELEDEERQGALNSVKQGDLDVLISSTIIDEGVDVPRLSVLINSAGMKSLRQTLQRTGRILRKKEDGRNATVIDFMDYTHRVLLNHSQNRLNIYEEEEFPIKKIES